MFSNSQGEGEPAVANSLLEDLLALMENNVIPVHVLDYQNWNSNAFFVNGKSYRGNEYFYANLTRLTTGTYHSLLNCCPTISELTQELFASVKSLSGSFDLHTTLANGFCYERFDLNHSASVTNLNQPIYQIGRYEGALPFRIEASGRIGDIFLDDEIEIPGEDIPEAGGINKQIWTGNRIFELEKRRDYSNQTIAEIIDLSLDARVLSLYTAFLALEPRLGGEPCLECFDPFNEEGEPPVVSTDDELADTSVVLTAFPNPFREKVTIQIENAELLDRENLQLGIYDLSGQLLRSYSPSAINGTDKWLLEWNAKTDNGDDLPGGIYNFVVQSEDVRKSIKLVYLN